MAAGNNLDKPMSTCIHTGLPLPANLINDNRRRPGRYRYRSPSGELMPVTCKTTDPDRAYQEACAIAERANQLRETSEHSATSTRFWVDQYARWAEEQNPGLHNSRGWSDRKASLRKFASEFPVMEQATLGNLSSWWDGLTFDQQHNRRSNYSQFYQWLMSKGVTRENPFNTSDALPHLIKKRKPSKRRLPIRSMSEYNAIYAHAIDYLKVAMDISLTTTMRAGDVVALKRSVNLVDTEAGKKLCRTIAKSANQRGAMAASHNGWHLSTHLKLAQAIKRGMEMAMKRPDRPDYIVNKRPQRRRIRKGCDDVYQVTVGDLSRAFAAAVKATDLWEEIPDDRSPPTFHEVRGFAIDRLLKAGIDIREVQKLAAHSDESVTSAYTAEHEPEYIDFGIVVSDDVLGK